MVLLGHIAYTGWSKKVTQTLPHHNFATLRHRVVQFLAKCWERNCLQLVDYSWNGHFAKNRTTLWRTIAKLWCCKLCAIFWPNCIYIYIYILCPLILAVILVLHSLMPHVHLFKYIVYLRCGLGLCRSYFTFTFSQHCWKHRRCPQTVWNLFDRDTVDVFPSSIMLPKNPHPSPDMGRGRFWSRIF